MVGWKKLIYSSKSLRPNQVVDPFQTLKGSFSGIPLVSFRMNGAQDESHQTAHYIAFRLNLLVHHEGSPRVAEAILLLYVTAIVFLVGTRPREGDLLIAAIVVKALIDELAAIVRVYTE